jgi:hypothetical protein
MTHLLQFLCSLIDRLAPAGCDDWDGFHTCAQCPDNRTCLLISKHETTII